MKNWTIGKRLILGFSAVLAVVIALGTFIGMNVLNISERTQRIVVDSLPGTATSGQLAAAVRDIYADTVLVIDARTPAERDRILKHKDEIFAKISGLLKSYEGSITLPEDRKNFDAIAPARAAFTKAREEQVLPLVAKGDLDGARGALHAAVDPAYQEYLAGVERLAQWNAKAGDEAGKDAASTVSATITGLIVGISIAVLLAGGVAFLLIRTTNKVLNDSVLNLREGASQVASAAGQVATSAQSLSQGSTEQAAALEETSASMEEMAAMTRQNAENASQAAGLMGQVDTEVAASNEALQGMVASMSEIEQSSLRVAKIIKTIDEIAFQTNILALNAAVEAARAGDAGMGFAVVADEVRNLAQRSAQAAKDTTVLIEESTATAQAGAQKVSHVAATFEAIKGSVVKVKGLIDEVSSASRQQSQGVDQVTQAINQMEKVTQSTAATAEESAAASEELNAQAEVSLNAVAELQALVTKVDTVPAARPVRRGRHAASAKAPSNVMTLKRPKASNPDDAIPMNDGGSFGSF